MQDVSIRYNREVSRKYQIAVPRDFHNLLAYEWYTIRPSCFMHKDYPVHECGRRYLSELGCLWCSKREPKKAKKEHFLDKPLRYVSNYSWKTLKSAR